MILKTAANYNDEGGYIEAWKNSDGTTEVKLIPKNGGGDEGKNGILSVTISPAITTTPALDSMFPIYLEDLTDAQKRDGVNVVADVGIGVITAGDEYTITVTPTDDLYAGVIDDEPEFGDKGEPMVFTVTATDNDNLGFTVCAVDNLGFTVGAVDNPDEDPTISVAANVSIRYSL